jgi:lipopolysaccharide biosynthesis glycosyltransferase
MMTTECAVCYASDINFLLPSLVSATGLRKFVPAHKADIYIFLVDEEARVEELNRFLMPYDIHVIPMDSRAYGGFDKDEFHKTHVPPVTLSRFFMDAMLPDSCRRIVYIDGDTWMRRDPSALIEAIVPDGKFAAVSDINYFRCEEMSARGKNMRAYFKGLGINPKKGYFNAGVFATSRKTWKEIAPAAYKFFTENTAICRTHDQSALNVVVGDRRLPLSLKWNFQTRFRYLGVENQIEPCIYHFTEPTKPWLEECGPWKDVQPAYQNSMTPFSTLNLPIKIFDAGIVSGNTQMTWKKALLLKSHFFAKLVSLYYGVGAYEKNTWL